MTMKFYCTAGRGTEMFVAEELRKVFGHDIKIMSTDGKTYFVVNDSEVDVKQKLMSLKTVERVFVEILHEQFQKLDRRGLLTLLHTRLNNKDMWENCISTLKQISFSQPCPQGADVQVKTDRNMPLHNVVCKTVKNRSKTDVGTDINVSKTDTCRTDVSEDDTSTPNVESKVQEDQIKSENKRKMSEVGNFTNVIQTETDIRVPEIDTNINEQTLSGSSLTDAKHISVAREITPTTKRRKLDKSETVTFRVSCRFSGYARKQLNIQRTSQQMGVLISKLLGWKIDLRHPKYEINIYVSDDTFTVGIPITNIPLSKRSYIKHCGLRTPIAWVMAGLLNICPGDVVLDPMCGSGTILLEASQMCQNAVFIGMDNNISQLSLAAENIYNIKKIDCMSLIHGDVRHMPFPDSSVDCVVTDAPFGQKHNVIGNLHAFYCQMISELARVVTAEGKVIILTSSDMVHFVTRVCAGDRVSASSQIEQHSTNTSPVGVGAQKQGEILHCSCNTTSQARKDVTEINSHEDNVICSHHSNSEIKCSNTEQVQSTGDMSLTLLATHNVKLGDTEGCILVLQKSKILKDL